MEMKRLAGLVRSQKKFPNLFQQNNFVIFSGLYVWKMKKINFQVSYEYWKIWTHNSLKGIFTEMFFFTNKIVMCVLFYSTLLILNDLNVVEILSGVGPEEGIHRTHGNLVLAEGT